MKKRVLVVDDDADTAELLGHMVQMAGYEPVVFIHGEDAVAEVSANPPDVILLDVMMARMDGWTLAGRLRAVTTAPIVFITAWRTGENAQRARELGAEFMTKPLSHTELASRLEKVLGGAR